MDNYPNSFSSYSISTYNYCPKKYELEFIKRSKGNEKIVNKYLSFDKSLHSVMAEINIFTPTQAANLSIDRLYSLIEKSWISLGYADTKEELSFKQRAMKILISYVSFPKDKGFENILINKVLRGSLNKHIKVYGKIDKVYEDSTGQIEIIDYKTGSVIDKTADFYTNVQLPLYLILVYEKLGIVADSISYYYLTYNKKITYKVTKPDIENAYSILEKHLAIIKKANIFSCRSNPYCKDFCSFYQNCHNNNSAFK